MKLRSIKNFANARIVVGTLTTVAMILGIAWFIKERDFEPALAAIGGILAFIATFNYSFLSFDANLTVNRIALVVANQNYDSLPRLKNVVNDAEAICKSLKQKGFRIIKRIDPSSQELIKAINDFEVILGTGGVGLFYYAGHAAQINGQDMILPVDSKIEDISSLAYSENFASYAINLNALLGPIDKVIEDSPQNNGSLVIYSTSSGGLAYDFLHSESKYSPFAEHFLKLLERWNLEIFDLFRILVSKVSEATEGRQVPWISASLDTEFYFKPLVKERIGIFKILVFDACRTNPFSRRNLVYEVAEAISENQPASVRAQQYYEPDDV
ncbi:MAG: caspase domain-containing protein [Sphaerospermopsis kisseleviana]